MQEKTSTELGESSTMLPSSSSPPRRRKLLTRRNTTLALLGLLVVLFSAVFFPVYFTRHSSSSTGKPTAASSTGTASGGDAASIARAKTTPGAVWVQPAKFSDLDDLCIEYYSSGQSNAKILSELPSSAYASTPPKRRRRRDVAVDAIVSKRPNKAIRRDELPSSSSSTTTRRSTTTRTTTSSSTSTTRTSTSSSRPTSTAPASGSVLSIFYPSGSYTPSEQPVGGTQFYALSPFDLSLVQSVTFNYSVFFPSYYDFVLGGKLPGLYGGTEGCGGGNSAQGCWSTRMAWRPNGTGELYAYLPQDKQNTTALLEVPPYSYVNADYGM